MKFALVFVVVLLWQVGDFSTYGAAPAPLAEPQYLRYYRSLTLPADASGIACAVLDANVYAHAANWSGGDLRVFRVGSSKKREEIPFTVSYSAAQPTDDATATVENRSIQNGNLVFDLAMPQRAYTTVDLHLAAQNFIATAEVSGSNGKGGVGKSLGTFVLFDLTQQHLARSTVLSLPESSFTKLHVTLRLRRPDGHAFSHLSPAIVQAATVPASREAQTLYTTVAMTRKFTQKSTSTVGLIDVAAHVPIERVSFILDAASKLNFLRSVSITAGGSAPTLMRPKEVIDGEIWRVTREEDASGDPAIHAAKLTLNAVIASNLREAATVKVEVKNGSEQPLPIKAIQLEMRQRTICFNASPGSTYMLRYGDDTLHATVYDFGGLAKMPAKPLVATLGPEELNHYYIERSDRPHDEHSPEWYWITILTVIAAVGAIASRQTKWRGRHR